MSEGIKEQKERLLVLLLTLHTAALIVANRRWSDAIYPFQKALEPYLIPTGEGQNFRAHVAPPRIAYQLALTAASVAGDDAKRPVVSGSDLPVRERAFLIDAMRRGDTDPGVDAVLATLAPALMGGTRPLRLHLALSRRTMPTMPFEALAQREVVVTEEAP